MDDDYKREAVLHVMTAGFLNLGNQCLPVSLCALAFVNQLYPAARVVIGTTRFGGREYGVAAYLNEYLLEKRPDYNPEFHAWIEIDPSEILDLTWASTQAAIVSGFRERPLDKADSLKIGLEHVAVIVDPNEVALFHQKIMHPDSAGFVHTVPLRARKQEAGRSASKPDPVGRKPWRDQGRNWLARLVAAMKGGTPKQ